ncbi:MAG: hypothetical protein V1655_00050 [bacterium]
MKKFFNFCFVAVLCCLFLAGCGDGDGGNNQTQMDFPDANSADPSATGTVVVQWREFDPRNLPEYKKLSEPSADEPSAIMGVEGAPSRAKSSDDFYNFLRSDLMSDRDTGEVRLDFYGPNHPYDIYGDYVGSRTVKAVSFFEGTAEEKVKAQEYYIHAMTYCELSGYCFEANAHVIFLPNESNRVLFSFSSTGSVSIPCYIDDPGKYVGDLSYIWWIEGADAYLPQAPYYEEGKLMFTICCYNFGHLTDNNIELHVQSGEVLHILGFSFNPLDITTQGRPLKLVAEELPTGTIQYGGEFEYEQDGEIVIDSPADGDVVNFPITIIGTTTGIKKVALQVKNKTANTTHENFIDLPKDGGFCFSIESIESMEIEGADAGDELEIIITDTERRNNVGVDVIVGPPNYVNVNTIDSINALGNNLISYCWDVLPSNMKVGDTLEFAYKIGAVQAAEGVVTQHPDGSYYYCEVQWAITLPDYANPANYTIRVAH